MSKSNLCRFGANPKMLSLVCKCTANSARAHFLTARKLFSTYCKYHLPRNELDFCDY